MKVLQLVVLLMFSGMVYAQKPPVIICNFKNVDAPFILTWEKKTFNLDPQNSSILLTGHLQKNFEDEIYAFNTHSGNKYNKYWTTICIYLFNNDTVIVNFDFDFIKSDETFFKYLCQPGTIINSPITNYADSVLYRSYLIRQQSDSLNDRVFYYYTQKNKESEITKLKQQIDSLKMLDIQLYTHAALNVPSQCIATMKADYLINKYGLENYFWVIDSVSKRFPESEFAQGQKKHYEQVLNSKIVKKLNEPAPKFEFKDINGKYRKLIDFKNQYVVINFWATWCGACVENLPALIKLKKKYNNNKNIAFISISSDRTTDNWKNGIQKYGLTDFINVLNINKAITKMFKIDIIPQYIIISPQGNIIYQVGEVTDLEKALNLCFSQNNGK